MEFHMSGSPFDIYDVPRSTMGHSPDDDTIYDYPMDFDLDDMEIYDYPPDAAQLGGCTLKGVGVVTKARVTYIQ